MRLPMLLVAAATVLVTAAQAQDAPPAQTKAEQGKALSDLSNTVEGLQDESPAAETPAQAAPQQQQPVPAATAAAPAPAPSGPRFIAPLTQAQRDQLAAASTRGRLLGAIASAGQIATRDMLSRVADPEAAGIAGWIAEPAGNGVDVTFYAAPVGDTAPGAVFRANILGGRVVSREVFLAPEGRPALNAPQSRMAAARAVAAVQEHRPCGADQFNYFVIPPAGATAPVEVYQISPQTAPGRFPLGGHFKTSVAPNGSIAETRAYANACVALEVPALAAGQRPTPLAVTHLMDPLPTEIHGFLSIWTGRPLVVVAGDPQRLFGVTPDGMGEMPRSASGGR